MEIALGRLLQLSGILWTAVHFNEQRDIRAIDSCAEIGYHLKMSILTSGNDRGRPGMTFAIIWYTLDRSSFSGCTFDGVPNLYNLLHVKCITTSNIHMHVHITTWCLYSS